MAEAGYDSLLVDIDPQCNATLGLGIAKDAPITVYDVLVGSATLEEILIPSAIDHLWVAPAGPCAPRPSSQNEGRVLEKRALLAGPSGARHGEVRERG